MIMSMERLLNPAWFNKRAKADKMLCTLSSSQYWDLLTYIDVSQQKPIHASKQIELTLLLVFVDAYRMTIFPNGR